MLVIKDCYLQICGCLCNLFCLCRRSWYVLWKCHGVIVLKFVWICGDESRSCSFASINTWYVMSNQSSLQYIAMTCLMVLSWTTLRWFGVALFDCPSCGVQLVFIVQIMLTFYLRNALQNSLHVSVVWVFGAWFITWWLEIFSCQFKLAVS